VSRTRDPPQRIGDDWLSNGGLGETWGDYPWNAESIDCFLGMDVCIHRIHIGKFRLGSGLGMLC
jgi:hypothetical protein